MRILHLSDIHIQREPGPNKHGVDPRAVLAGLLDDLAQVPPLDLVLVTGDIADDGSVEAYLAARTDLLAFAATHHAALVACVGNHDDRAAFADVLGAGHFSADGQQSVGVTAPGERRAAASQVDGVRVVSLDSLVPGKGYGEFGAQQVAWLRGVLSTPAPRGTVLAFHHPPIGLDVEVQHRLGLQDVAALVDAIDGSDVRLVLCGHFHLQLSGRIGDASVFVTPGVVSRVDLSAAPGTERAVRLRRPACTNWGRSRRCRTSCPLGTPLRARRSTSSTATSWRPCSPRLGRSDRRR